MLSDDTIDQYRRMTLGEKLALVMLMTEENTPALLEGSPEVVG